MGEQDKRENESERGESMNWIERILGSDAGRGRREVAERMVREAGGEVPEMPRLLPPSPETVIPDPSGGNHD